MLQQRFWELSAFIDDHGHEMRPAQLLTAIDNQGRLANRIGRLLRDRQQLAGASGDELEQAVAEALSIVGDAWGVALSDEG